ncbi:MAG: GTP cyclohydrolase II [Pseudomonadota bacterium]
MHVLPQIDARRALVERYSETRLPTVHGMFRCIVYRDAQQLEHVAMVRGVVRGESRVLCRVHSECLTSEVLGSLKCDCKAQLDAALEAVAAAERGVVLYLRQEGRGIGLGNKIQAYALQELGLDTVDANRHLGFADDLRCYDVASAMLDDLRVKSVLLLTNNPDKVEGLREASAREIERVPLVVGTNRYNRDYLETKRDRMGHLLDMGRSSEN